MSHPNIYYSAILLAAGVACLVVAVMAWQLRREAPGATPLTIFLLGLSWWDITYAVFWVDFPAPTPYFWLDITMVGGFVVPTAFLVFALEYSDGRRWLSRPVLFALAIEPILACALMWTDSWHDLYFDGKRALNTTRLLDAGPVHWANAYYSYLLILAGVIVLARFYFRSTGVYRRQAALILAAVALPWTANFAFLAGWLPSDADTTPFIFSITALIMAFALTRYRLLNIVPVARSMLIENMNEGVLVLNSNNLVVDINPEARRVLPPDFDIGQPVQIAFRFFPDFVARFFDAEEAQAELLTDNRHLDLRISPLRDDRGKMIGRLVVWRDISDLIDVRSKLETLAITDELTGVYNRRHFMKLAESQVLHARRHGRSLAMGLIDLDYFKGINDTYGHAAGDRALAAFAHLIRENVRDFDVFGRLGGEEFGLLMPDTEVEQAFQAAERLRVIVEASHIFPGDGESSITFSLGLGMLEGEKDTLGSLLRRADHALYAAKHAGRNRVIVWRGDEVRSEPPV